MRFFILLLTIMHVFSCGKSSKKASDQGNQNQEPVTPKTGSSAEPLSSQTGFTQMRIVNAPLIDSNATSEFSDADWILSSVFWLGINEVAKVGKNYTDVRIAYSKFGLHVRQTIVDYALWYKEDPEASEDLSKWDAAAIAFDMSMDRNASPDANDRYFLATGQVWVNPKSPLAYQRNAKGDGKAWDFDAGLEWKNKFGGVWSEDPGWNNDSGNLDYGFDVVTFIPWESFGLSAAPVEGTVWGMGVFVHDRDGNDASAIQETQTWPEHSDRNVPSTWGVLRFGTLALSAKEESGTDETLIRAKTLTPDTSDNTVEDAWIGGGGNCTGGHEGGTLKNNGDDTSLFVENQALVADFPCFSRSYLRFALDAVPADKTIVSASLRMAHWGNAGSRAQPSYIHAYRVKDAWEELTLNWNNAPMAQENIVATWVEPKTDYSDTSAVHYYWDITNIVQDAYKQGTPLNIALYSSDTGFDSSKYFGSSEAADQYIDKRPMLTVKWK